MNPTLILQIAGLDRNYRGGFRGMPAENQYIKGLALENHKKTNALRHEPKGETAE